MACGLALKRSLDFDPLHNSSPSSSSCDDSIATPSAKRRRYSIAQRCGSTTSVTTSPPSSSVSPSVWRRYTSSANNLSSSTSTPSPFANASKKCSLSSEQIVKHVYQEYRRMKKRRQIHAPSSPPLSPGNNRMYPGPSSSNMIQDGNARSSSSQLPSISLDPNNSSAVVLSGKPNSDTPLLSMKQVGLICERLLKEQEDRLSSEYEKALVNKLSEQYDAFVKFSHDQLRQQLQGRPASYVS